MKDKKTKVIMAKVALDGHDRGLVVVSMWLRDLGMEVVHLGRYQTVDKVVQTAIEEDADIIGLSFLGGEHLYFSARMREKMKERGVNAQLIVGGIIPKDDIAKLKEMGVDAVFPAGTPMQKIVDSITQFEC